MASSLEDLVCWQCGASLDDLPLPVSRRATCTGCSADLHVCRMCEFYDRSFAKQCREPVADEVSDKERANFCGYLSPRPTAFTASSANPEVEQARSALDDLFGLESGSVESGSVESGSGPQASSNPAPVGPGGGSEDETEAAKRKLAELFGLDKEAGKGSGET